MGERKGTNKYYPPDFDPKKHRSLDAYHGTHALRERARKLHEGILIIRFEMPYNIWCDGCNNHIGMGVRYNAEKSKIGMYYTTPIYKFRMKCHLCDNHFEIKTDPANHDYVIIEGARRKEQRWDPKENEQIVTEDKNDQKKMALDAMFKIEHGVEDKNKSKQALPGISQLTAIREQWKDDYDLNKLVRRQFREKKKQLKTEAEEDQALLKKSSLSIQLLPENSADKKMAELLKYRTSVSFQEKQKEKRDEINKRSIFASPSLSPSPASTPSSSSGGSDSSEGSISKAQIKHKEAYKMLTKIAIKHPASFSPESFKAKVARTGEGKISKQLGIVCKPKIFQSVQKTYQQDVKKIQKTRDVDRDSNISAVQDLFNTESLYDKHTTAEEPCCSNGETVNDTQKAADLSRTSKTGMTEDYDSKDMTSATTESVQKHSLTCNQDSDNCMEKDTRMDRDSASNSVSVNALNNLMSTYTDSSGESD